MLIELTVLYEPRMEWLRMYKFAKYEGLVADLRDDGYTVRFFAVEVDARGLVSKSTYDALKPLGLKGATRNRTMLSLSEAAEKAPCWLWFNGSEREREETIIVRQFHLIQIVRTVS